MQGIGGSRGHAAHRRRTCPKITGAKPSSKVGRQMMLSEARIDPQLRQLIKLAFERPILSQRASKLVPEPDRNIGHRARTALNNFVDLHNQLSEEFISQFKCPAI